MPNRLQLHYRKQVVPELQKEFQLSNRAAVPTVEKIVVNVGFGKHLGEAKHQEIIVSTLERITGQKPSMTKAKKSISSFKLRAGQTIGAKVTLRGQRMWEFLDKFIHVTLARVRDFQGISPSGFGGSANLTVGVKEHTAFPEIRSDEVENIHGLEVTIVTSAKNEQQALSLLSHLGFPFVK
jgi:large subunit ribosomal protein L5